MSADLTPENVAEARYCGRGICAAMEGHEGTCAEASGWDEDGGAYLLRALDVAVKAAKAARQKREAQR